MARGEWRGWGGKATLVEAAGKFTAISPILSVFLSLSLSWGLTGDDDDVGSGTTTMEAVRG